MTMPGNFAVPVNTSDAELTIDTTTYSWEVRVCLLLILPVVIICTIIGNLLVCLAVSIVPRIRNQPYAILYVSLAVADLFVAAFVMPIALLHLYEGTWRLGRTLCDLFVSADLLSCTASILSLCAISYDRYQAITDPLKYSQKRVEKRMLLYVVVVWGVALLSLLPIVIIGNEHGNDDACTVSQNFFYQVWATVMSFYLPLFVIIFVNIKILITARIILRKERRAQGHLPPVHHIPRRHETSEVVKSSSGYDVRLCQVAKDSPTQKSVSANNNVSRGPPRRRLCRSSFAVPREMKALVTLGVIMTAFILCWLPFFILALIRPLVAPDQIPQVLSDVFLWLGYFNSLLNPIIYVTFNKDFRRPFREFLCLRCRSLRSLLRQEQYLEQYGASHDSGSRPHEELPVRVTADAASPTTTARQPSLLSSGMEMERLTKTPHLNGHGPDAAAPPPPRDA